MVQWDVLENVLGKYWVSENVLDKVRVGRWKAELYCHRVNNSNVTLPSEDALHEGFGRRG